MVLVAAMWLEKMVKNVVYCALMKIIHRIASSKKLRQSSTFQLSRFNGFQFTQRSSTKYQHRRTRLATYKNKPFAIGGFDPDGDSHNKVEQLDFDNGWEEADEYPFATR